jgi:hypothetical protein
MRYDEFPASDPEAEGLPATADDDSHAGGEGDLTRWADGPDPAALPADEPVAAGDFGTTAEEQLRGEPLDRRLWEEEPDTPVDPPLASPGGLADEAVDEQAAAQAWLDDEVYGDSPTSDPRSEVSLYDDDQLDDVAPAPVGRLVEGDGGLGPDDEPDSVARDAGFSGGGLTAEELAMHETDAPPYR